ncbi:hypothetical protein LEP1GSC050_1912 [Leptospira broomii serovar Hurstbridge str. 5399]|uniref:Fibronectin type III domain protein n=1 Tax=Leptospira broomii serovar Hurstbridge str. 5399 TaxID=1049789 RepID=T0F764_9LEPT|nr:hypothetical protein [Leptospira broomii]EQA43751.1 hypothetical protein LEP1GSC050_1912 [Leptospira broomii serovar Hurstbridge str. 5399]
MKLNIKNIWQIALLLLLLFFINCPGSGGGSLNPLIFLLAGSSNTASTGHIGTGPSRNVLVTWQANREKSVNSTGGGYQVCYGITPAYQASGSVCASVPYVSGATAPTGTTLSIPGGSAVFIYVFGFSTLNTSGAPAATPKLTLVN